MTIMSTGNKWEVRSCYAKLTKVEHPVDVPLTVGPGVCDLSPVINAHNRFSGEAPEENRPVFAHRAVLHPGKRGSWQQSNEGRHGRETGERRGVGATKGSETVKEAFRQEHPLKN